MSPDGRDAKRVVTKPETWAAERDPAWSPDGKSLAFSASSNGQFDLWIAPAGSGIARHFTTTAGDERWPSWTRDGRIVYSQRLPGGEWRLVIASADGSGTAVTLSPAGAAEWHGRVSPDGKLIALA
jgi:Tol biopolymer transport system component